MSVDNPEVVNGAVALLATLTDIPFDRRLDALALCCAVAVQTKMTLTEVSR